MTTTALHKPKLAYLIVSIALPLSAQITGDLRGTALDPTGAAIPEAQVTLRSLETGQERALATGADGRFQAALLRIGAYRLRVSKDGFATAEAGATIRAGEVAAVDITLVPGQLTETVTVTEAVSRLDTENSQIQLSVSGRDVQEIPVRRDPNLFAVLAPGTAPVTPNNTFVGSGSFNVNGMRGRGNNITVDGITATDVSVTGTAGPLNPLNFSDIKEVKVITNGFSAEYGRNIGSQVMYLSKNGTNQLHGELYEYFRNDKLNARPFFDTTGKPSVIRRNQYGFSVGGPVFLPQLADLRNRTFWFASYEGQKQRGAGAPRQANVPTQEMVDAVTDPTSRAILALYQVPTSSTRTLATQAANAGDLYRLSFRVDQNLGARDTAWVRYARSNSTDAAPGLTFINTNLPGFGATSRSSPVQLTTAETHTFGATAVNEFRFGYGANDGGFLVDTPYPLGPRIQFSSAEVDRLGVWEGFPQGRGQKTYQFSDNLSFVRARHFLKAGGEFYYLRTTNFLDSSVRPVLTFVNWTDFAAGRPSTYQQRFGPSMRGHRVKSAGLFFQDDWKVNASLTLNLGLRYERAGAPVEVEGRVSNLNLDDRSPFLGAGAGPLGNLQVGQPPFSSNNNWAPRVGFAWSPGTAKRTVIRGGYGITYDFIFMNPVTNQRALPPLITTGSLSGAANFVGANSLANIYAGTALVQQQSLAQVGVFNPTAVNFGNIAPAFDQGLRNPQAHQWNFGIQHDLAGFVLKASYVGTKGNYLLRARDLNFIAAPVAPAASVADESARLQQFQTAFSGLNGNLTTRSNRIDGRYNAVTLTDNSANSNYHSGQFELQKRFSSVLMTANYTFAKSIDDGSDLLNVLLNDSPTLQDPRNARDNRGPSQFDLRHRVVITHNWELPFAKRASSRLVRTAFAGWNFSGITTFRSGFPVTLEAGGRRGITLIPNIGGGGAVRPNVSGPADIQWVPTGAPGAPSGLTNPDSVQSISAYAASLGLSQPLLGNFGTLGRNTHRLNGETNFDWNVFKNFTFGESRYLQVRGELYNVFNNTSFQEVNRNISSPGFGQYTVVGLDSRNVQLAARLVF